MSTPPSAGLAGVTKRYGDVLANEAVDLTVAPGEIHAVVGENGAGKSTAVSILFGLVRPDAGHVLRHGRPVVFRSPADAIASGLGMVHQRFRLFPGLSVADNVVIGAELVGRGRRLAPGRAADRVRELGERFGLAVDPAAVVGDLPVGIRQRVEILKALHREADVLILDEPTAVLTPGEATSLFAVLRTITDRGASVVLVTHKLGEVLTASDTVTVLRSGRVVARRTTSRTSAPELVRDMIGRDLAGPAPPRPAPPRPAPPRPAPPATDPPATDPPAAREEVLAVRGLTVRDADGVARLSDVSLTVHAGEIVGVAGVAGSGQRELVDSLTGLRTDARGSVRLRGVDITGAAVGRRRRLGIGYVPEDRHGRGTAGGLSVADNLLMGSEHRAPLRRRAGRLSGREVLAHAGRLVERFSVRTPSVRAPISALSGGNAQKAVLARELSREVSLVVVEEPTQGVDVGAQENIHRLLRQARDSGRAVLVVSSELSELRVLADRVLVVYGGRVVAEFHAADATDAALGAAMTGAAEVSA